MLFRSFLVLGNVAGEEIRQGTSKAGKPYAMHLLNVFVGKKDVEVSLPLEAGAHPERLNLPRLCPVVLVLESFPAVEVREGSVRSQLRARALELFVPNP
mgnify:FL=1